MNTVKDLGEFQAIVHPDVGVEVAKPFLAEHEEYIRSGEWPSNAVISVNFYGMEEGKEETAKVGIITSWFTNQIFVQSPQDTRIMMKEMSDTTPSRQSFKDRCAARKKRRKERKKHR